FGERQEVFSHQLREGRGGAGAGFGQQQRDGFGGIANSVVTFLNQPFGQSGFFRHPEPQIFGGNGAGQGASTKEVQTPSRVRGRRFRKITFQGRHLFIGAGGLIQFTK